MRAYIIDVGMSRKVPVDAGTSKKKVAVIDKTFAVLTETTNKDANGASQYAINLMSEAQLVQAVAGNHDIEPVNFRVINGQVKNKEKDASLSRFNQEGYKEKPITALATIVSADGKPLGYLYSTNNGYTHRRKTEDFIADCKALIEKAKATAVNPKEEFKPIQNMKFIPGKTKADEPQLAIYNESNPLPVVKLAARTNAHAKPAEVPKEPKGKRKSSKEILDSLYTPQQLKELKAAKEAGVDIRFIANPKFSPEQMNILWKAKSKGQHSELYADPEYDVEYMRWISLFQACGVDMTPVLNPKYNSQQATEILRGIQLGLDVNVYSDPSYSSEEMYRIRRDLEQDMWGKGLVYYGNKQGESTTTRTIKQPFLKDKSEQ